MVKFRHGFTIRSDTYKRRDIYSELEFNGALVGGTEVFEISIIHRGAHKRLQ